LTHNSNGTPLLTHVNSDIRQIMAGREPTRTASSDDNNINVEVMSNGFSTSRGKVLTGDIKSTESELANEMSP
jgi:hypothetical protein